MQCDGHSGIQICIASFPYAKFLELSTKQSIPVYISLSYFSNEIVGRGPMNSFIIYYFSDSHPLPPSTPNLLSEHTHIHTAPSPTYRLIH